VWGLRLWVFVGCFGVGWLLVFCCGVWGLVCGVLVVGCGVWSVIRNLILFQMR